MNILNKSFIYFLITLTSFYDSPMERSHRTHLINNTYYSTSNCNCEFWECLLKLLQVENSITLKVFTNKFPDIKDEIKTLYKLIGNDRVIYFCDINLFLLKLNSEDYTTLMEYILPDGLDTPSDWSSIGSSDEELEDVVITFNINETISSPIHVVNSEIIENTLVISDSDPKQNPLQENVAKSDMLPDGKSVDTVEYINPIIDSPKKIKYYDPTIIPKKEFYAKQPKYCAYCNDKPQKYSWYMSLIVNCAEWIKVPTWIRKYF